MAMNPNAKYQKGDKSTKIVRTSIGTTNGEA